MVLMLAIAFLMAARYYTAGPARPARPRSPLVARGRRLPVLALGLGLALVSLPTAAWANAPATTSGSDGQRTAPSTPTGAVPGSSGSSAEATQYAAREAKATALQNFEGGDTTVVIGGSALVIIVVVLLILILI